MSDRRKSSKGRPKGTGRVPKETYINDPLYQAMERDRRRNYRAGRQWLDNRRRQRRRATDPDFCDRERARRYGLSLADFRAMLERQGHACAICRRADRPLQLDHFHATNTPRGFLCRKCNLGLGNFDDDPSLLRAAAAYLEAARATTGKRRRARCGRLIARVVGIVRALILRARSVVATGA
jgi:hypothetical protein